MTVNELYALCKRAVEGGQGHHKIVMFDTDNAATGDIGEAETETLDKINDLVEVSVANEEFVLLFSPH